MEVRGERLAGRIAAITRNVRTRTRTVPVLIDLVPGHGLSMGEVVRLVLERRVDERGAWVPIGALTEAERGLWSILTVTGPEGAQRVGREAVEVLHLDGGRAFVRGTFADGALIVPGGAHRPSRGQAVIAVSGPDIALARED